MSRWAALESSWVSANEVDPWIAVANKDADNERLKEFDVVLHDDAIDEKAGRIRQDQPGHPIDDHQ